MGKLSHIDDVEQRNAAIEQEQMRVAQEALSGAPKPQAEAEGQATQPDAHKAPAGERGSAFAHEDMSAQDEEDFHGLSSVESMVIGQKIIIVLAVIVFIAAILYVLNSWLHFV